MPGPGLRRRPLEPGGRADQQAALDLLGVQAVARPGDLGLRPAGPALHPVPSVQLDGPAPGPPGFGADRQLAGDHPKLILHLVEGTPIRLVDGGAQKRCFTDVDDGIEALARIIDNRDGRCDGQIVNIGNPDNEASIRQLGEELLRQFEAHPLRAQFPPFAGFREVESRSFYGDGYQDVAHRKPSIDNARRLLDWQPTIELRETIGKTLDFFLHEALREREAQA